MTDEVAFVMALPGWDVLYYFKGGRFETAPIVAWGIIAQEGIFVRAFPVTTDLAWSIEDSRPISTPDGDVTCGDLERWETVQIWLDEMIRRETENPNAFPSERPSPQTMAGPKPKILALDNFRHKFQQGE